MLNLWWFWRVELIRRPFSANFIVRFARHNLTDQVRFAGLLSVRQLRDWTRRARFWLFRHFTMKGCRRSSLKAGP